MNNARYKKITKKQAQRAYALSRTEKKNKKNSKKVLTKPP